MEHSACMTAMTKRNDKSEGDHKHVLASPRSFFNPFQLPTPVKRIFDKFPLKKYPPNDLPCRSPRRQDANILHVFNTPERASRNEASFNPACLQWQAYLKFCGVQFKTVASNNHASPTGVLPFLTPANEVSPASSFQPIASSKILKWATSQTGERETISCMSYEAYTSLIDYRIRSAWLFNLYLDEQNSEVVVKQMYIYPTSSNPLVQMTLYLQLRQAAQDELLKSTTYIKEDELYLEAEDAFKALSTSLGDDTHFFAQGRPTLFDAKVFSYTHLLLDESLNWQNTRLADSLKKTENLVRHRQRLLASYFG